MNFGNWNKPLHIFMGAVLSLIVGWATIAFGVWLTIVTVDYLDPTPSLFPRLEYIIGFGAPWLVAFPIVGFAMGFICASFWRNFAPAEQQKQWAIGLVLIFFLPVAILGAGALCILVIELPLLLWAFNLGIEKRARWRHLFGLTNDWEREADEN